MHDTLVAGPGRLVTLTFSLALADGTPVDRLTEPATFEWGDESLLPAFQKALEGGKAGDKRSIFILAKDAFGMATEDNVQYFKPEVMQNMGRLQVGTVVNFLDDIRFNKNEADVSGVIRDISDEWITVDFNHPLAGRDLLFAYEIVAVQVAPEKHKLSVQEKLGPMSLVHPEDAGKLEKDGF